MVIQSHTCIDYKQVKSPLSCDEWYILKKMLCEKCAIFCFIKYTLINIDY